jgi:hypothetical protein
MQQGFGISTAAVWQSVRRKPRLSIFVERRSEQLHARASRPRGAQRRASDDARRPRAIDRGALQVGETDGGAATARGRRGWVSLSLERRSQ